MIQPLLNQVPVLTGSFSNFCEMLEHVRVSGSILCGVKVTHNCCKDSSVKRNDRESLEEDLEFIVNVL